MRAVGRETVRANTKATVEAKNVLFALAAVLVEETGPEERLGHEGL